MASRSKNHHKTPKIDRSELPEWMLKVSESSCLYNVAEAALTAKNRADAHNATEFVQSAQEYAAGMKDLATMNNIRLPDGVRTRAATSAARKFWKARVAARRMLGGVA